VLRDIINVKLLAVVFLPACLAAPGVRGCQPTNTTYSGDAYGASVRVLGLQVTLSDTGPLPSAGGSLSKQLLSANVPGVLNLGVLTESTTGGSNAASSRSSVANLDLDVAGVSITASVLTANASAQSCAGLTPGVAGSSNIVGLVVDGQRITVTGAPNQTIPLIVGALIINEQISSVTNSSCGGSANMKVNALHLTVAGIADVVISSAQAGVSSVAPPA